MIPARSKALNRWIVFRHKTDDALLVNGKFGDGGASEPGEKHQGCEESKENTD